MATSRYSRVKLGIVGVAAASIMFGAAYFQSNATVSALGTVQASSVASANPNLSTFSSTNQSQSTPASQTARNVTTARAKTSRGS